MKNIHKVIITVILQISIMLYSCTNYFDSLSELNVYIVGFNLMILQIVSGIWGIKAAYKYKIERNKNKIS